MAGMAVSISMGVMTPVLEKLATLMGDKYKNVKGLRKQVEFLNNELSEMKALLEKMDDADELDPLAKKWRKDIIEMSYDIEDYIDDFTSRVGEASDDVGVLWKASHFLRTFKDRYRIASEMKEIKAKVIEASERRKRYNLDHCIVPSTTHDIVDPRLSILYQKSSSLVGIDSQKEDIVRWVMDEGEQLKMMSIVGFGGLGKTTLANEVYHEVGGQFDCKAFISISQNPNIMKLLKSLMFRLGLQQPYHDACKEDLIKNIRKYLQDKRYFIIIDDLWDIPTWKKAISLAFPQNNCRSRIMITTRIEEVATKCCENHAFIHHMKPLSKQDSRKLFFDRVREPDEDDYTPDFIEDSYKILKKCGGLPLAIITMASMIACQPTSSRGQWAAYIQDSIAAESEANNPTYKDMMHIIDLSYKNLPRHLKACFLYLGTYPEDHKIERIELVRRWVAEGFVKCSHGQDVWDVAESYFNELVNRSMIQPESAYKDYNDIGINVTHCRVHDMMLELIVRKCREDNFITMIDGPEMVPKGQDKVIRRLTIDLRGGAGEGATTVSANTRNLAHVRSVNIFRGNYRIRKLMEFKFMRVLFLDIEDLNTFIDLTDINHLSQLRYLKVRGDVDMVLFPSQIRGLRLLETLDLSELFGDCSCLPPEMVDVPRLTHVTVTWTESMRFPDGIGNVKSLLTLSGFSLATSSLESITSLGELTDLSELFLNSNRSHDGGMVLLPMDTLVAALVNSLEKLGNLRKLILFAKDTVYCGDAMMGSSFSPPFGKIERLYLKLFILSSVPRWIGHLCCLRELFLCAKQIHQEDFNIIGTKLTSLIWLGLSIVHVPKERIVIGGSTGFKVLKVFVLDSDGLSWLTFEAGAMPDLQQLELDIYPFEWDKATPVGLQHLPNLKRIKVRPAKPFGSVEPTEEERLLLCDVFQEAAEALPTRPAVGVLNRYVGRPQQEAI